MARSCTAACARFGSRRGGAAAAQSLARLDRVFTAARAFKALSERLAKRATALRRPARCC
eukprot:4954925-Lingulodinium_polyedra.AAC.1